MILKDGTIARVFDQDYIDDLIVFYYKNFNHEPSIHRIKKLCMIAAGQEHPKMQVHGAFLYDDPMHIVVFVTQDAQVLNGNILRIYDEFRFIADNEGEMFSELENIKNVLGIDDAELN